MEAVKLLRDIAGLDAHQWGKNDAATICVADINCLNIRVTYTSTRIIPLSAKKVYFENAISGLKLGGFWHCCH